LIGAGKLIGARNRDIMANAPAASWEDGMTPETIRNGIVKSYCILCAVRCPIEAEIADGRLVRVKPDLEHPMGGPFCPKGAAAPELVTDPARLKYPMKRTNPKGAADPGWVRVTWDEALETIAANMLRIREELGPEAVAFYRPAPGGSAAADYNPWLWRLAHAFGSPNIGSTTHICQWHRDNGSAYTYGVGLPEADYDHADCIIIWGTNPHATGVRHVAPIKRATERGARLIVIDPRHIALTGHADHWLQVRPTGDLPLALGLIRELIETGGYDAAFLARWTNAPFLLRADGGGAITEADLNAGGSSDKYVVWDEATDAPAIYDPATVSLVRSGARPALEGERRLTGKDGGTIAATTVFAELKRSVAEWTPDAAAAASGVAAGDIVAAAATIGSSRAVCYYSFNGIEQHTDATQLNRAICILYGLTGDFDKAGGVVSFPPVNVKQINGMNFLKADGRGRIGSERRPLGPATMGHVQSYALYQAITKGDPYPVKGLVCFGGNMIVSNGDTRSGAEAVRSLDFYAHMDLYENPTSRFADILLPAASSFESEAVGIGMWRDQGNIQLRRALVEPGYERRSDLEVMFDLAVRVGLGNQFFNGDLEAAYNDQMAPLGITVDDLRAKPLGIDVPRPPRYAKYAEIDETTGNPRGFKTPSRLMEIYSLTFARNSIPPLPVYRERPEQNVDRSRYPLLLTAAKPGNFLHGCYRSVPSLRQRIPEPQLEINPATATARSVADGDWIAIDTPFGSVRARAAFRDDIAPEVVVGQEGWWQECEALGLPGYDPLSEEGSNLNLLTGNALYDPVSGSVPHRGQPCEVRPVG
jgi:anaerobic selenocysteine-containing dehydrogenase